MPDASDGLLLAGGLLTAAAIGGLAGGLWALGWLGVLFLIAGTVKGRG